ncbi:MAG TPA: ATPase, T2SS/T4P/T4SS family [Acidimicrobiales bacterium]|nr:ATPase, T2SS/T4P/T4SS family [Acidimicrobiales bacterium]
MSTSADVEARLHNELLERARSGDRAPTRAMIVELARREAPLLGAGELDTIVRHVAARTAGLGPLEALLTDPTITEVMVNAAAGVWVERAGRLTRTDLVLDHATVGHVIERVVAPLGLRVDRSSPLVDARLPDGSRVNAVVPPVAIDGPCLTIRRFGARTLALEEFGSSDVADLLRASVIARRNMLVTGGTGSGKTTLLNSLAACLPHDERIVTVEDAAELRLPSDHVVRLEARPASAEGLGAITIRDLVRNALRMRPDRIVVGEVRGAEALDMLQAMNTGHEGSLSTCHANSPDDALRRIETMVLMGDVQLPLAAVREQVHASLDLVVHLARRTDGTRRITAVAEVAESAHRDMRTHLVSDGERVLHPLGRSPR